MPENTDHDTSAHPDAPATDPEWVDDRFYATGRYQY